MGKIRFRSVQKGKKMVLWITAYFELPLHVIVNMASGMSTSQVNKDLLLYIIARRPGSGVTELMKLSYLIDLTSIEKGKGQISHFKYVRYTYGPFDSQIYNCLNSLTNEGLVKEKLDYTHTFNEYITYTITGEALNNKSTLTEEARATIDEVVNALEGHGAKALTEVTYKTKPMKKLRATLGGNEHLGIVLDLDAK